MENTGSTRFESIGVYLPEKVVTTQELIDQMKNKPQFDLEDLTGVKERRWWSEDEDSLTLAISAARQCLRNSKYEAKDLDVIISCSITRLKKTFFQLEPAFSKDIKNTLGMRSSAVNFDITTACAGMMTGVYILDSMIKNGNPHISKLPLGFHTLMEQGCLQENDNILFVATGSGLTSAFAMYTV